MVLSSCQSHCESLSGIIIIIITNEYWVTKKLWEHVTVKEKITALSRSQTLQSSVHLNSRVFNHYLKQESDFSKWQSGGKLFHTWEVARGAASQTKPTDMVHESACRLVNVPYWMLIWSVSGKERTFPLDVFLLQGQDFAASFRCVQSCLHFGIGVSFALRTGSLPWNSTVCVCVCVCCKERRISAADALLHPYLEDGRLRYHSCMCHCCYRVAGGRTVFADDPEPCHSQPFESNFEQELSSVSRIRGRLLRTLSHYASSG